MSLHDEPPPDSWWMLLFGCALVVAFVVSLIAGFAQDARWWSLTALTGLILWSSS